MSTPNYEALEAVLARAVQQAAAGKGAERHALPDEPFERQQICQIPRWQRSISGQVFQVCKKSIEAERLPREAAVRELLGAIVYAASAVLVLEEGAVAQTAP